MITMKCLIFSFQWYPYMCYVRAPSYINDKTLFCQKESSYSAEWIIHGIIFLFQQFPLRQQPRSTFWLRFSTAFERNKRYRSEAAEVYSYAGKTNVTFLSDFPTSENKKDYIFGISMKRATIRYAFRPIPHGHLFPLRWLKITWNDLKCYKKA